MKLSELPRQHQIIELVKELITSRGVMSRYKSLYEFENFRLDEVSREAFRYYGMIIKGKHPLDIDIHDVHPNRPQEFQQSGNTTACIGCLNELSIEDLAMRMPVCQKCRTMVRTDFKMLQEIFE